MRRTLCVLAGILFGCGSETGARTDTVELEIGINEHCDTALANATIYGNGDVLSPQTYDNSECRFAYLVNLYNYSPTQQPSLTRVSWADVMPTVSSACTSSYLRAYEWEVANPVGAGGSSGTTYLGSSLVQGQWNGSQCTINPITFSYPPAPFIGKNYRYAVSAESKGLRRKVLVHVQ